MCNGNAGPGEMLIKEPRVRSGSEHSFYFFAMFDFAKIFNLTKQRTYKADTLTFNNTKT